MQCDDAYLPIMLLAARLPEAPHAVAVEEGFVGDENEIARLRLGDEHAVERIAVVARQRAGPRGVSYGDRQFLKVLVCDRSGDVRRDLIGSRKFAKAVLGDDLPGRRRADEYDVRFVGNSPSGKLR